MAEKHWNIPGRPVEIYLDIYIPAMIDEWVPQIERPIKNITGEV